MRTIVALAVAIHLITADVAAAQSTSSGRVERTLVATLGSPSDTVLLGLASAARRLSDGRFVASSHDLSQLMLFAANGTLIRVVGRRGQGPGEFSSIGGITVGPGDTIWVRQPGRFEVFTAGLDYVRTVDVQGPAGGTGPHLQLRTGDVVWSSQSRATRNFLVGMPPDGSAARSFGASRLPAEPCGSCRVRLLAQTPVGAEFYAIAPDDYKLERWNVSGELKQEFRLASDWLPERGPPVRREPGTPPPPTISGIMVDEADLVWVAGVTPNQRWKPLSAPAGRVGGANIITMETLRRMEPDYSGFTTIVDILDPSTGRLLASARFEGELVDPMADGYMFARKQDDVGFVSLEIWKLALPR